MDDLDDDFNKTDDSDNNDNRDNEVYDENNNFEFDVEDVEAL